MKIFNPKIPRYLHFILICLFFSQQDWTQGYLQLVYWESWTHYFCLGLTIESSGLITFVWDSPLRVLDSLLLFGTHHWESWTHYFCLGLTIESPGLITFVWDSPLRVLDSLLLFGTHHWESWTRYFCLGLTIESPGLVTFVQKNNKECTSGN
jgi:hypothetical protein